MINIEKGGINNSGLNIEIDELWNSNKRAKSHNFWMLYILIYLNKGRKLWKKYYKLKKKKNYL